MQDISMPESVQGRPHSRRAYSTLRLVIVSTDTMRVLFEMRTA